MKKSGLSLIELLITVTLFSVIAAVVSLIFLTGLRTWDSARIRANLRQDAGLAMERMARELSEASAVNTAKSNEIDFDADLDGNGTPETIKFAVSHDNNLERTESGTSVILARAVQSFTAGYYLDGDNDTLLSSVTGPSLGNIRVIVLTLALNDGDETFTLSSSVYIRNQGL